MSTPNTPSTPSTTQAAVAAPTQPTGQAVSNPPAKPDKQSQGTAAAAPSQPPRMMKIKVDGKEMELPESEVLELASAGRASNQRFQEAAKLRREAEAILKFAKDNPEEIFQKTGMNPRDWAEKYLIDQLKRESESPEQKRARENEEKLRKFEQQEKQTQEKQRQEELQHATSQERERLDKLFTEALFESGLPRTKFTVKRMAELQLINIKNKFELSPQQLAKLVREDYVNEQKALLGSLEGDGLLDFLGPDLVKKLSKAQIAKLKARGNSSATTTPRKITNEPTPGMSWRDYQKKNRRRPV